MKTRLEETELAVGEFCYTEQAQCEGCEQWTDLDKLTEVQEIKICPTCLNRYLRTLPE